MTGFAAHRVLSDIDGKWLWLLAALSLGIGAAVLPLSSALLMFGSAALLVLIYLEPRSGVLVLLLFAPLKALIETESTAYPLPLDIGQITLIAVVFLWLLNRVVQRQPLHLRLHRIHLPVFMFIGAVLLSLPGALSLSMGLNETLKWAEIALLVLLIPALFGAEKQHWLVFALVLAGSVQAVIGIYEFLGGSGAEHLWILDGRFFRAFGSFGQPNPFGAFMGITLPLGMASALGYGTEAWQRFRQSWAGERAKLLSALFWAGLYGGSSLLILGGLLASWSRGAWLGFAGAIVVMLVLLPRAPWKGMLIALGLGFAGIVVWNSGVLPDSLTQRMSGFAEEIISVEDVRGVDVTDSNYAVTERIAHWQAAVRMAEDHPWTGVGFGNYEAAYGEYALVNWPQALGHAHNYYLNLLAETGVIGLSAYVITWIAVIVFTLHVRQRTTGHQRLWSIALIGVWSYLTIHNIVDKLYVNNMFLHIGCMLGLLASMQAEKAQ